MLARVRPRAISARRFRQLATLSVLAIYVVVTTGAVVRLTASGLGCDNWPRCGDTPFPEKGGHAFVEFGNRVVSLGAILVALACWLASRRVPALTPQTRRTALAVFVATAAQIPLGGVTVIFELHPVLVMSHFLLALAALGLAVVVALDAWSAAGGRGAPLGPHWWRQLALLGVPLAAALVVTGAVSSASGPHSGGEDIRRLGLSIVDAVYVHVRVAAAFGVGLLVLTAWLARRRREAPGVAALAGSLLAVLVAQAVLGEVQYRSHLPWGLVLVHVSLAAAIWAGTVALVYALWRPPAPLLSRAPSA